MPTRTTRSVRGLLAGLRYDELRDNLLHAVGMDATEGGKYRAARDPATGKSITVPGDMSYREWYGKYVGNGKEVANPAGNGIIESQRGGDAVIHSIDFPIEQRNTGKGNPSAMLVAGRPLNERQKRILAQLPSYDSRTTVRKSDVSMRDLAALTAETGDEFAVFTRKGKRLIVRGNARSVNIDVAQAQELSRAGYRWTGHTHPGTDEFVLFPSDGDKLILQQFSQELSCIYNSKGSMNVFGKE